MRQAGIEVLKACMTFQSIFNNGASTCFFLFLYIRSVTIFAEWKECAFRRIHSAQTGCFCFVAHLCVWTSLLLTNYYNVVNGKTVVK